MSGPTFTTPNRAALEAMCPDPRTLRALEQLFALLNNGDIYQPGDLVWSAATTRVGALAANGQAVSRATYPNLLAAIAPAAAVTLTIASPCVITWTGHGLGNGTSVYFTTTGALPTGLVVGTEYFVVNRTTNTLQVAATLGGAAINTTGSQSGIHTLTAYPFGRGDGTTTFNVPDVTGRVMAGREATSTRLTTGGSGIDGAALGAAGGAETHVLTIAEMPSHTHTLTDVFGGGPGNVASGTNVASVPQANATNSTGGGGAHTVTQPTIVLNAFIIF